MRGFIRCYTWQFMTWAKDFAARHPRYQQKDGSMAWAHIVRAVEAEGFTEINASNLDAVCAALEARATRKAAEAEVEAA